MKHVNKCTFLGNAGGIPRQLNSSKIAMATVNLATNKYSKGAEGKWDTQTSWHKLTFYDKLAERAIKEINKGDVLWVEGELKYSTYDNKDGVRMNSTEISVKDFTVVATGAGIANTVRVSAPPVDKVEVESYEEDVPF